ncbi:MAG: pilus assembly protein PilM, partial [Chloroflexota bacterium]
MSEKVTTIFIEDTGIRLLISKGKEVVRWASAPLEPGLVSGSIILDEARVAEKLKELFLRAEISAGKVIAGLSGLNSLYRLITLPELPKAILPEAVRHEAGRVIPASLDEVYLSYQTIPAPSGETRAFLAAYSRKETDVLVSTLRRAGLKPTTLDLLPLSLCRTVNKPKAIIASVRSGCLDIIVMVNAIPQVIRNLPLHGEATLSSENITAISEELERTVAFYNSSHTEEPLDSTVPVFVSGDLAEAQDHWQSLVGTQMYPVSELPSPMEHPKGFPANEFMVNIGLALKRVPLAKEGAYFSLVNLNALPEIYKKERESGSRVADPIDPAIRIGILAIMGFL